MVWSQDYGLRVVVLIVHPDQKQATKYLHRKYLKFFLWRISTNTPINVRAAIAITNPCIANAGIISDRVENGLLVNIEYLYIGLF